MKIVIDTNILFSSLYPTTVREVWKYLWCLISAISAVNNFGKETISKIFFLTSRNLLSILNICYPYFKTLRSELTYLNFAQGKRIT